MSYVLTFVASQSLSPVTQTHISAATEIFKKYSIMQTAAPVWLSPEKAVDIGIAEKPSKKMISNIQAALTLDKIDVFVGSVENRRKRLLMADMDSTIVTGETLDELAAFADLKGKIAAITTEAMEGKLDFHEAVRKRVGLLKDLPITALDKTLELIELSPGADTLVKTMRDHGAFCVLVSGGFTFFTHEIADQVGFHKHHGNELKIDGDHLTGEVVEPIQDKFAKLEYLKHYISELSLKPEHVMSIGDGANDLPMLQAAGLGIGYKPKDVVYKQVDNAILHGDLSAALYAQGYTDEHIK